jgi:4-hydroxy-tetrahydrodipicolinate reductase
MSTNTPLRAIVVGPGGRMGARIAEILDASAGAQVVGFAGRDDEVGATPLDVLAARGANVFIDFSHRDAVAGHAAFCVAQGLPWVLGSTGIGAALQQSVDSAAQHVAVFQSANFSIGVALLTELCARAAAVLGHDADVEIVEHHHHHKVDAPSGTALSLARAVAAARGQVLDDVVRHGREGLVGARPPGEIGIHALRLGDIVGHHEVHFGWPAEGLVLTHEARDRGVFALGAVRAARFIVAQQAAGRVGLFGMPELLRAG